MSVSSEPVLTGTAITGVVTAGLTLATAFGWDLTQAQQASVLGLVTALILVVGVIQRSKVTPASKAIDAIKTALDTTPASTLHAGIDRQATAILSDAKA